MILTGGPVAVPMDSDFSIRAASLADHAGIRALYIARTGRHAPVDFAKNLPSGHRFYVACRRGRPGLAGFSEQWTEGEGGWINNIVVAHQYEGTRLAEMLAATCINCLFRSGHTSIAADATNPAGARLARKMGGVMDIFGKKKGKA
jgi:hypothetical protein